MKTQKQKRIAKIIQQELADILQGEIRQHGIRNLIISISKVNVTPDLSLSRVYISIYPSNKSETLIEALRSNTKQIKHEIARKLKNQLRKMPELRFFIDDSLDHIEKIDKELKNGKNPIR